MEVEAMGESVVVWRSGTVVVVMPVGRSVWDPDDAPAEASDRVPVRVEWLQELRTLLDAEHHLVCAPLADPDWLTLPEADLPRVARVLGDAGYRVVVERPLPTEPHAWADLLEADLQDLLDEEVRPLDR